MNRPNGFRRLDLHGVRGMGIGPQGEARVGVTRQPAHRADIHPVLQRQGLESMVECTEAGMLRSQVSEHPRVKLGRGIRAVHPPGTGAGSMQVLSGCFSCSFRNRSTTSGGIDSTRSGAAVFGVVVTPLKRSVSCCPGLLRRSCMT